jgi:hypothetical protein
MQNDFNITAARISETDQLLKRLGYPYEQLPDGLFLVHGSMLPVPQSPMHEELYALTELPDLSLVIVEKNFTCNNSQVTTLKGAPREVRGSFTASCCKLVSLEGAPQKIGGDFYCPNNQITSLAGAPQDVGGKFVCYNNKTETLEHVPRDVKHLDSDFGKFDRWEDIPFDLRVPPQLIEKATVTQTEMQVRRPLSFRQRAASFLHLR